VLYGHYEKEIDRESAYEKLKVRAEETAVQQQEEAAQKEQAKMAKQKSRPLTHRRLCQECRPRCRKPGRQADHARNIRLNARRPEEMRENIVLVI